MKIKNYPQALKFINEEILAKQEHKFPGRAGLERIKYLVNQLGNPQNKLKVIHIAGTSGKSSTAYILSKLFHIAGYKTGTYLSPHLNELRERIRIDNRIIPKSKFVFYLNKIIPAILKTSSRLGPVTFFEALTALAFFYFYSERVHYAVIETGLGGRYDGTNVVNRKDKLAIITKIGKDHVRLLGNTYQKIAAEKLAIIQPENKVVALYSPRISKLLYKISKKKRVKLFVLYPNKNWKVKRITKNYTLFDFNFDKIYLPEIKLGIMGQYQAENTALALAGLYLSIPSNLFKAKTSKIKNALTKLCFEGRMEIYRYQKKFIILDGAHNPQKMKNFIQSIKKIFPEYKPTFLIAIKKGKDFKNILKPIIKYHQKIILTTFTNSQDSLLLSEDVGKLKNFLYQNKARQIAVIENTFDALDYFLKEKNNLLIASGSLYLISKIRPKIKALYPKTK